MATCLQSGRRSQVAEDGPESPNARPSLIARFEMAITVDDLKRLYRYIPGGEEAKFDGHSVTLAKPVGGWSVALSNPRTRSLGLLTVPLANVEIEAWGCGPDEFAGFVERFLLVFHKGGG
jgi:hypothetical protein